MTSYEEAFGNLNDAQRQVVEATDGPVLVIAGPGTGKTQLLTTRIAHILATTDTLPHNILCLTFTESAAQTMRERLSGMIGQDAYNISISTYHAFGSELIRRFPDHFPEVAEMRPADDLTIDTLFREIIEGLPFSNPLKFSEQYLGDVKTLISDAKRALLAPEDLHTIASHNESWLTKAQPVVGNTLDGLTRITKDTVPLFAKLAKRLADTAGTTQPHPRVLPLSTLLLQELREALNETEAIGKTTPLTAWKNTWLAKDSDGRFVVAGARATQKIHAAADIYAQYLARLDARQMFDYDDMILRAVRTLEQNADLRYTLQEQYLYILLDEFQDTNEAQLRLVELLTDNPASEGRPNVMAVGDDDQAIYAFQGADYSHMLSFQRLYRDVLVVPLTQNYRSHPDVLHTARGIAEQIEERLHHHFPQIEKELTAENKNLPKEAVIERREARSDVVQFGWTAKRIKELIDGGMAPSDIAVLAPQHRHLEPLVPFLRQEGIPMRYEKRENVLDDPAINQLLRMSELCLALASGKHTTANALWAEVLSFAFWQLPTSRIWQLSWQSSDDGEDWTEVLLADEQLRPIVLFFIRVSMLTATETLETILDYLIGSQPVDLQEPGLEPFASPFYNYYFGDLAERAAPAGAGESTVAEPDAERRDARLGGQHHARERSPAPAGAVSGSRPSEPHTDFWSLLTSLTVLRSRMRNYQAADDGEPLRLPDFIQFAETHRAADIKILNTSPYQNARDAVQLMTAYKAKGQEFGAVFVLNINDEGWGSKARTRSSFISLPANLQFIRYAGATEDERLRLFYVALTRAKTHLYLTNYTATYAGKTMTRLKYLSESPDENGVVHSPLLPAGKQTVLVAGDGDAVPTTELAAYWQQRHTQALSGQELRSLLLDRLRTYQLSPTHLNMFTDIARQGPEFFLMDVLLRFPRAPSAAGEYGSAIHETIEWIHRYAKQHGGPPALSLTLRTFEQRLAAKRLSPQHAAQYAERGTGALTAYLQQRSHTISPDNELEFNFRREGVFLGDAHLSGKIDKLIVDKENKTIQIVDFKTGKGASRWHRDIKLHRYRQQLYLYKALVEHSHTFGGYQVTNAYLEFVEPDEDGQIHELVLRFDAEEEQHIRALAQAIWRRVKVLDLPDTTPYTPDLPGIEQFEKDLLR
jgi:DNA helicase-2/ATP-dependent DNA helicase PcrA